MHFNMHFFPNFYLIGTIHLQKSIWFIRPITTEEPLGIINMLTNVKAPWGGGKDFFSSIKGGKDFFIVNERGERIFEGRNGSPILNIF